MYLAGFITCTAGAALTFVTLEIARHVQYLKHRDSGFVPGTQHWCLAATLVAAAFEAAAVAFLVLLVRSRGG